MNTLQKTIIIILVVILIMGLIIGGFFLYQNKTFSKNDPNEVLLKYVEALSNKNYEKAVKDYSIYISLNPNDAEAYNNRALARMHIGGQTKEAVYDCLKALKLNPEYLPKYRELPWLKSYF